MAADTAPILALQCPGQADGIAIHHQVDIRAPRNPQQQIAHKTTDNVEPVPAFGGSFAGQFQQLQ